MVCDDGCPSTFDVVQLEEVCNICGFTGWSPGDGRIYQIPTLENGKIISGSHSDIRFLNQLISSPNRTRMNAITLAWELSNSGTKVKRLERLRELVEPYGLDFVQMRDGQNIPENHEPIVNDEPLLLMPKGLQITFSGCNPAELEDDTQGVEDDFDLDRASNDIEAVTQLLRTRDLSRGILDSSGLKPEQERAILQCLETPRQLNIFSLPTGYGKTRIAQVVSWALRRQNKGPVVMISPLISLMDDQRHQFEVFDNDLKSTIDLKLHPNSNEGFNSVFLTEVEERDNLEIMSLFRKNKMDLLCCSPERLVSSSQDLMWIESLCQLDNKVSTLIIDEAHVIGDWGASIRPEFQMLSWIKDRLLMANPNLRVILMSATISLAEEQELIDLFNEGLLLEQTLRVPQTRKDLYFHIERHPEHFENFGENLVNRLYHERLQIPPRWNEATIQNEHLSPLILYCPIKKSAKELKPIVASRFGSVEMYTGDTPNAKRESIRLQFRENRFPCLIGTSAFGMGIDKADIWTTAYVGMPHTLKGLYQAFGRAARRSNWDNPDFSQRKSGVCFASIPDTWPLGYKSPLGIPKTLERLWDMFCSKNASIHENGYVVVPIKEGLDQKYWLPSSTTDSLPEDDDDTNDDSLLWKESLLYTEENRLEQMRKLRSIDQLYKNRLWVLSCLQRSGAFTFQGIHSRTLKIQPSTNSKKQLVEVLDEFGYSGVVDVLGDTDVSWKIPDQKPQFAVLKVNRNILGWEELGSAAIEGYNILKERYSRGRGEVVQFLKDVDDGQCIRKLLSPTIGILPEEAQSCIELIRNTDYCMPCSNCKSHYEGLGIVESFIWSDERTFEALGALVREIPPLLPIQDITFKENRKRKKESFSYYEIYKRLGEMCHFAEYDFTQHNLRLNGEYQVYISDYAGDPCEVVFDNDVITPTPPVAFLIQSKFENWGKFMYCQESRSIKLE